MRRANDARRRSASYRQNHTRTANAPNNHATAARKVLMIVRPIQSHANAESAKASVVTPATMSSQVAVEVGKCVVSSSIAIKAALAAKTRHSANCARAADRRRHGVADQKRTSRRLVAPAPTLSGTDPFRSDWSLLNRLTAPIRYTFAFNRIGGDRENARKQSTHCLLVSYHRQTSAKRNR
jgi:hypothetical protein